MLVIPDESIELQKLVVSSMSRYTFGIVQPSKYLVESQELATGVGIKWHEKYFILTAAHVVAHCPEQTLRFFLPANEINFAPSDLRQGLRFEIRGLMELGNPQTPVFADDENLDLALIKLPQQQTQVEHFIPLDDTITSPPEGTETGIFGYPHVAKIPWKSNFMASPVSLFGKLVADGTACLHPPLQDFTVQYGLSFGPKGFSGSGVWFWQHEPVWLPQPRLAGLITRYCPMDDVLSGYSIETIMKFLIASADLLFDDPPRG